jgi:MFS family permease
MTGISVHLVEILNDNGLPLTMAISVGAMPSQVGIRFLDAILPKKTPLNSALVSSVTIFVGLMLFLMSQQMAFLAVICFGLGNGMRSILRGTLPLWIFGADSYATIMGRLAGLPMVAQALTPLLSGYMIAHFSVKKFVSLLVVLAFINIITMVVLRNKILNKSRVLSV